MSNTEELEEACEKFLSAHVPATCETAEPSEYALVPWLACIEFRLVVARVKEEHLE